MAKRVERWEARDGTLFFCERDAVKHDASGVHECPKCNGLGRINGQPILEFRVDEEATAWMGQFASPVYDNVIVGHEQIPCDVCDGQGWTEVEKKPITKTKTIGWE